MIEALLIAARDRLMSELKLTSDYVKICPKGQPPASMGEFFISLDEANVQSGDKHSLKETFAINVWFTLRSGVYPDDRNDEPYLLQAKLLTTWERRIIKAIHNSQEIRESANGLLTQYDVLGTGGFTFPLYYTGRAATEMKAGWVMGDSDEEPTPCMVRQLPFSGGLRIQNLDTIA